MWYLQQRQHGRTVVETTISTMVLFVLQAKIRLLKFMVYSKNTILKGANTMITNHAIKRAKERTGLSTKSSVRFIECAFERGKEPETFTAAERKYMLQKARGGSRSLYHNGYCFIISADEYCITMYQVPEWFGKKHYDGKHEIRNIRKYIRMNNDYQEDLENGISKAS